MSKWDREHIKKLVGKSSRMYRFDFYHIRLLPWLRVGILNTKLDPAQYRIKLREIDDK